MPGVRRPVSRVQSTPPPVSTAPKSKGDAAAASSTSSVGEDKDATAMSTLSPPKHAHIPEVPIDNNIMFEAMAFMFAVIALCLQYIHLYKTVWWLPQSHSNYALNFYLIDPYLVLFLIVLMSRRLAYCFLKEVQGGRSSRSCLYWLVQLCKFLLILSLMVSFGWTAYRVILRHSLLYSLFLCYPLVMYVILFGFNMRPLFGKTLCTGTLADKGTPKHKNKDGKSQDLHHTCSTSPEAVRDEVDSLKTDFNNRLKQVLFSSMLCAYYMGFVPLCFAQHVEYNCDDCWNTLYYDIWWVGQHVVLVWISAFVIFMVHFLPVKYIDVLHCCALHLGKWVKVEGRHAHVPYNAWSELQVWQQGALVKHVRGLFKAEGINNSAEPGNGMHARFYFMFHRPLRVTNWLLILTALLVLYQFVLLVQAPEWSHLISLTFLLFCNYYILFKLMRDRFILARAYKDENASSSS